MGFSFIWQKMTKIWIRSICLALEVPQLELFTQFVLVKLHSLGCFNTEHMCLNSNVYIIFTQSVYSVHMHALTMSPVTNHCAKFNKWERRKKRIKILILPLYFIKIIRLHPMFLTPLFKPQYIIFGVELPNKLGVKLRNKCCLK